MLPGGDIYCSSCSDLKIQLLYGNLSSPFSFTPRDAESSVQIAFTNFMGGIEDRGYPDNGSVTWLEGNIDVDPLFNDADNFDYTLIANNSHCIDVGTAFYVYEGDRLINLSPDEYVDYAPDLGYHEVGQNILCDLNQEGSLDILDVVLLADIILGEEPTEWEVYAGDMNSDGSIDVLNVVRLVDVILERES